MPDRAETTPNPGEARTSAASTGSTARPTSDTTCHTRVTTSEPARGDSYLTSLALVAAIALAAVAIALVCVSRSQTGAAPARAGVESTRPSLSGGSSLDPAQPRRSTGPIASTTSVIPSS